jgi:predicted ABC-type ATPase
MQSRVKRLRIFAGPNGSGKSSLLDYLVKIQAFHLYYHINADDIARDISIGCDYSNWPIVFSEAELKIFLEKSPFQDLAAYSFTDAILCTKQVITLTQALDYELSYLCAALADFLRQKLFLSDSSFSYETVFSHPSKIDDILQAKKAGFKIYLYIIATESPNINLERIADRVKCGGHAVPENKTKDRFNKTLRNLGIAYRLVDRAYFYDNSGADESPAYRYFAEKNGDSLLVSCNKPNPKWFKLFTE